MRCPNCGTDVPEQEWNCPSCRINVYWVSQHYEDLAQVRAGQGLSPVVSAPAFLRQAHEAAMGERGDSHVEHKVRKVARQAMRRA